MAPGVKKPLGITSSKKFSSKIHKICKKFWRILKNSQFYCVAKTLLNTPHLGSFSAVNSLFFWGFLAVIFALLVSGYLMETHSKVNLLQNHTDFFKFCNFIACAKTLLNTPHLGWCSAVNFLRNSTRFSGFLAVIFTSQWFLASRNQWGLWKATNSLQKFI